MNETTLGFDDFWFGAVFAAKREHRTDDLGAAPDDLPEVHS